MMTPSALLSVLTPAMPGGETRSLTPDQSAALLSGTESFFGVMAQVRGDGFPKLRGEANTGDCSPASQPSANPSGEAVDILPSMTSALMAVMAQPRTATMDSKAPAANAKSAPFGQGGQARFVPKCSNKGASPRRVTVLLPSPAGKAPRITAVVSPVSRSAPVASVKNVPAGQGCLAKPLAVIANNGPFPTEAPKAQASPPGKASRVAMAKSRFPASAQAVTFQKTQVGQSVQVRGLMENSNNNAVPTQAAIQVASPSDQTLRNATVDSRVSASAGGTKNLPVGQGVQVRGLTENSNNPVVATQAPIPIASPSDQMSPNATVDFRASTSAGETKDLSAVEWGQPKPSTGNSNDDAVATQAQIPIANPSGQESRNAAVDSRPSASNEESKDLPSGQRGQAKPLAETANKEASLAEVPKASIDSPVKTTDEGILAASTMTAMAGQPQIIANKFRKPATAQAVNSNVVPEAQEKQASSIKTPEPPAQPSDKATDMDPAISNQLTDAADQGQRVEGEVVATPALQTVNNEVISKDDVATVVLPSSPAGKPESVETAVRPAEPAGSPQQLVAAPVAITPPVGLMSADAADGTGGALTSQRMKFGTEKNEIAGPAEQKLPTESLKTDLSARSASDLKAGSGSDPSSAKQNFIDSALMMNLPAQASAGNVDAAKGTGAAPSVDHAAIQAERVGHLLNQQVVMIRQSGANNIAVSLKLDPHTELSLQLTNHNGQIEASVRWERGSVAGLENHWKDLQESLARQNVQLLPLETRTPGRSAVSNYASDTTSGSHFHQSSQNPQRQSREARQDLSPDTTVQTVPVTEKATTRTVSRQGWESWA